LLWSLRGRDIGSSVGALVTVAALVIDPFAQQVIQAHTCPIADPKAQVSIPKNEYGAGVDTLRAAMQSAIYAVVYNPETITILFDCTTGNCTFEDHYSSLGYCSSCVDLTSNLKVTTSTGYYVSGNETVPYTIFRPTLPSGLSSVYSAECVGGCYGEYENQTLFVMGSSSEGAQTTFADSPVQMIL
jgi:hypothetical protein